jgi:hypothetical protein
MEAFVDVIIDSIGKYEVLTAPILSIKAVKTL